MENKALGLLGIARRAGHAVIGFDAVKAALQKKQAHFILFAADRSEKTEKELRFAAQHSPCPIQVLAADKAALSRALGLQKPVAVVAVDDRGFATAMLKHFDTKEDVAL